LFGPTRSGDGGPDDGSQRGDVPFERLATGGCEAGSHAPAPVGEWPLDRDVPGLLERRELLRECRVRQPELVADEREVDPVI
jgi:hypothetical protein